MDTPIYDFARDYAAKNALRLHMPGHKGLGQLGVGGVGSHRDCRGGQPL